MIEKIPFETEVLPYKDKTIDVQTHASPYDLQIKINELVDAVNSIVSVQEKLIDSRFVVETKHDNSEKTNCQKNMQDEFAEQRKWIGKLCKFWDYDGEEKWFSILEHIDKNSPYTYCASGDWWYKHCEPAKPDDDIIYKGGDNE